MSDLSTRWNAAIQHADWSMDGYQLLSGSDLETAVLISIFTDRTANPDDVIPDGSEDPRGWWADDPQHPIGSRLWLLSRSKETQQVLALAQDYVAEALQWLIDDGVVARFDILCEWTRPSMLGIQVAAHRISGSTTSMNFNWAWRGIQ